MNTRFPFLLQAKLRKPFRDILDHPSRSLLLVAALSIGVFSLGIVLSALDVMTREIDRNYRITKPADIVVNVDNATVRSMAALLESSLVSSAERRGFVTARIENAGNRWINTRLFVVDDFDSMVSHVFLAEAGSADAGLGQILIERSAVSLTGYQIGDDMTVKLAGSPSMPLQIVGSVHDPGQAPAKMEGLVYGYISSRTAEKLGAAEPFNRVFINLSTSVAQGGVGGEKSVGEVRELLESAGAIVESIVAQVGDEHPHRDQMNSFLFILYAFAVMATALSSLLIGTVVSGHMTEQKRQIGIMKAVGGSVFQVISVYVLMIGLLGATSAVIAMPLVRIGAEFYVSWATAILNFDVESYDTRAWILLVQFAVALVLPIAAAMWPILRASRMPTRVALFGSVSQKHLQVRLPALASLLQKLSLPGLFVLRGSLRRPGRLIMAVSTLAVGGAMFMTSLNLRAGWYGTVEEASDARRYDIMVRLDRAYDEDLLTLAINRSMASDSYEFWNLETGRYVDSESGSSTAQIPVLMVEHSSSSLELPLVAGRWLKEADVASIVVTERLLRQHPTIQLGEQVDMSLYGVRDNWLVVGVVRDIVSSAAYASKLAGSKSSGTSGKSNIFVITVDQGRRNRALQDIESAMAQDSIDIVSTTRSEDLYKSLVGHIEILTSLLLVVSMLVAFVGSLGLMAAANLSTLERIREIGILKAIGARHGRIFSVVSGETWVQGAISWMLAILLAMPLTLVVGSVSGKIFVGSPVVAQFPFSAMATWGIVTILLATLASGPAAYRSMQWSVRKALDYDG